MTTKILPQINHQIKTTTEMLHNMISATTEKLLQLTEALTCRIAALEQTNSTTCPPEPKKHKASPTDDHIPIDDC